MINRLFSWLIRLLDHIFTSACVRKTTTKDNVYVGFSVRCTNHKHGNPQRQISLSIQTTIPGD